LALALSVGACSEADAGDSALDTSTVEEVATSQLSVDVYERMVHSNTPQDAFGWWWESSPDRLAWAGHLGDRLPPASVGNAQVVNDLHQA